MMRSPNGLVAVVWIALACVSCDDGGPRESVMPYSASNDRLRRRSRSVSTPTHDDFGEVSIDDGPQRLEHRFQLVNRSAQTRRVEKITTSCGCATAVVLQETLDPHQATELVMAVDEVVTGRNEQVCEVTFSDGGRCAFCIRATGTRSAALAVIPVRTRVRDRDRQVRLTLQLTHRRGAECKQPPAVFVGDRRLAMFTEGWTVMERASDQLARPLRQMAHVDVDLGEYEGAFPVELTVIACHGLRAIVTVDHLAN